MTLDILIHYTISDIKKLSEVVMKYWSKSALSIYRYLNRMTKTMDKLVVDNGKNSNHQSVQRQLSTHYQVARIIELIDRKRKMINLKVGVEQALCKLPKSDRRILSLSFIDGVTSEMIAQFMGISLRTFFRKKNKAITLFGDKLQEIGFDSKYFENEYMCEKWFVSIYDECVCKYNKEEEYIDNLLLHRVWNELSQFDIRESSYLC